LQGSALKRFALLLCSRLPSARSAIHPFPNTAGLRGGAALALLPVSPIPGAHRKFTHLFQGFALKPLSPDNDIRVPHPCVARVGFHSCRFSRFTFSLPHCRSQAREQPRIGLILQGSALKRLALLLCSRLPSARSAIHPFPNIAGLRGGAALARQRY
jgi:hypothetical protein